MSAGIGLLTCYSAESECKGTKVTAQELRIKTHKRQHTTNKIIMYTQSYTLTYQAGMQSQRTFYSSLSARKFSGDLVAVWAQASEVPQPRRAAAASTWFPESASVAQRLVLCVL